MRGLVPLLAGLAGLAMAAASVSTARATPTIVEISLSETITLTDSAVPMPPSEISVAHVVNVADSASVLGPAAVEATDAVHASDTVAIFPPATVSAGDVVSISDAVHIVLPAGVGASEPITIADAVEIRFGKTATITSLTSAPNPSAFGQLVSLTATVAPAVSTALLPTGTLTFTVDGLAMPMPLVAGVATLQMSSLGVGSHAVTASYAGDSNYLPGASGILTQVVSDTEPPTITAPANVVVTNTPGTCGAVVTYASFVASDNAGPVTVELTAGLPSGSVFPIGTTTVSARATDAAGNTASASFTVTVIDAESPTITAPANVVVPNTPGTAGAAVSYASFVAADRCSAVTVVLTAGLPSGSVFPIGVTTVTARATDAAGNTASASFTVTVVDTEPPVLTLPSNITAEATGPAGATVSYTAAASDLVDGAVAVTCIPASGSTFAVGATTVHCSATDAHLNTATGSFTVTVVDTTPPVISGTPANITLEATGPSGAIATWTAPSASDLVDGAVAVVCTPASGSTFALGTTVVTCRANDAHGNPATTTFTVTVRDTTAPITTFTAQPGPLHGRPLVTATATVTFSPGGASFSATCFDSFGLVASLSATDSGSGVAAIRYGSAPIVSGQPLPNPALSITAPGSSAAVTFASSGAYMLNYAAIDNAGTPEATHSRMIFVSSLLGVACATSELPLPAIPHPGTVTVSGSLLVGGRSIPIFFSFSYR